ncbi:MAG: threonine ammonia-lyase IlvA [Rhizobiaceae bacterium]
MTDFVGDTARVHTDLKAVLEPTPLQYNQYLSDLYGADIWLKREDLSPVRSYKIRGAYTFFNEILKQVPSEENFVCASAGNHAQGFSHACRNYKKKGVIFMPVTTPQQKIMKTKSFGEPYVEIILIGDSFDEANDAALKYCNEEGGIMVPPFDDERIILGQATIAKELLEQLPVGVNIDLMVLPVGGGGLAAGVTHYMKSQSPDTEFCFVEPDNAPSLQSSLKAGERIKLLGIDNFVDGAAVAEIGATNFEYLKEFDADQVVLAPTNGVCVTMIEMLNIEGVVLEPAGALSVDALKRLPKEKIIGKTICCVTSGGNFDFERLPEVKERALKFSGLKKYFILKLPQRPGALKDFLLMLGPNDDISRFEYLKKSARNFGSVLIGIETTDAENFDALKQKFDEGGLGFQDITDNDLVASLVI